MKLHWRHLVKPEILLLAGAVQANLPYLLWRFGYPVPRPHKFDITYRPLYLWILGYLAFCLGAGFVSFFLYRKKQKTRSFTPFSINQPIFQFCILAVIFAAILQITFACLLYGVVPLLAYSSGYDATTLNVTQDESGFGQLGLMRLTLYILSGLILIGIVSSIKEKGQNRKILWIAVIVVIFGSLFSGKTQGFFIFICFLLTGGALTGVNPINLFMRKLKLPRFSKKQMIVVVSSLLFSLVLLHGFTRSLRIGRYEEFNIRSSFNAVVAYLSWPVMNMEKQTEFSGLQGSQFEIWGLVTRLLPYKMRWHFLAQHDLTPMPKVEPTSPSGFPSIPHWYLGLWGMMAFIFVIGVVCNYIYIKSNESLFCLLAYSQIAWTLIAAHTYNHFLNLLFIPAPLIAFFILTKVVEAKRMPSKAYARELIWT